MPLGFKIQTAGSPVSRIVTSLEQPVEFQAVNGSQGSHRLKIRELRELYLADPLLFGQINEHLALPQRQAEGIGSLFEALRI